MLTTSHRCATVDGIWKMHCMVMSTVVFCHVASPSQSAEGRGNVGHWLEDVARAHNQFALNYLVIFCRTSEGIKQGQPGRPHPMLQAGLSGMPGSPLLCSGRVL